MEPTIADRKPIKIQVEAGQTYWFCTCGKSSNQPFCNGSHKGTDFRPLAVTPEASGDRWFCQCKHSSDGAFCDGSHKSLPPG